MYLNLCDMNCPPTLGLLFCELFHAIKMLMSPTLVFSLKFNKSQKKSENKNVNNRLRTNLFLKGFNIELHRYFILTEKVFFFSKSTTLVRCLCAVPCADESKQR